MHHYVDQLYLNGVCILFGAEQEVFSGYLELNIAPTCAEKDAMRVVRLTERADLQTG